MMTTMQKQEPPKQEPPYIPIDLVSIIMQNICWTERATLSCVCKSWKELFHEIEEREDFFPWFMSFNWNSKHKGGMCKLCDPRTESIHTVKPPTKRSHRKLFVNAILCSSRCGWLLFAKVVIKNYLPQCTIFFLYSPFTNQIIKFPKLRMDQSYSATFSSSPGSPDCMVFVISPQTGKLCMRTCQPYDKSWRTFEYSSEYTEGRDYISNLVYAGNCFYCFFSDRTMGEFNIKKQEWELLSEKYPVNPCGDPLVTYGRGLMIAVFKGSSPRFWRFKSSEKRWVVVDESEIEGKHVIFLNNRNSTASSSSFSIPALRNATESAGNIYTFDINSYDPYCVEGFDFGSARPAKELVWMDPSKEEDVFVDGLNSHWRSIWIQPPFRNPLRASSLFQSSS